jgi:glycine/D-amino acid oxidase-like deaminating enzyme
LVKIAPHDNTLIPKVDVQDEINDINLPLMKAVGDFIKSKFPTLASTPDTIETCYYTMTHDEDFLIDFAPENSEVVIAAGFSGHGFKFTPLIGKIIADLVIDGSTSWDLTSFKIQ